MLSHTSDSYHVKTGKTMFGISLYHPTNPKIVIQVSVRDSATQCWSSGLSLGALRRRAVITASREKCTRTQQYMGYLFKNSLIKNGKNLASVALMVTMPHTLSPCATPVYSGSLPPGPWSLLGLRRSTWTAGRRFVPPGQTQPRDPRPHFEECLNNRDHPECP